MLNIITRAVIIIWWNGVCNPRCYILTGLKKNLIVKSFL